MDLGSFWGKRDEKGILRDEVKARVGKEVGVPPVTNEFWIWY